MTDLIDVLDEVGLRTGEVLPRAEIHRLGKRHRAVRLYLLNAANELLLQRRGRVVDHAPDVYSISMVGHVNAGESSAAAVRRELAEELGVDAAAWQIDFLFSYYQEATLNESYIDRQFNDIYFSRANLDPATLRVDSAEVAEVKFVPFAEFLTMIEDTTSIMARVYGREVHDLCYLLGLGSIS